MRANGFEYGGRTMEEELSARQAKAMKPKRKIPWITIISIASCLPLFMGGGIPGMPSIGGMGGGKARHVSSYSSDDEGMSADMPQMTPEQIAQGKRVLESIEGDTATISITLGDKVITKEVPVSEIQKAMGQISQ